MTVEDIPLFSDPYISVFHRPTPNGYLYTVVKPRLGVGSSIIPVIPPSAGHPESRFLVVSQHRPPISGISWEFPAGAVDEGESPLTTAVRELAEETNIIVNLSNMHGIGQFHNAPSIAQDIIHSFVAVLPEDYDENNVVCQENEIVDYKWLTTTELIHETLNNVEFNFHILGQLAKAKAEGHIQDVISF